MCNTEKCDWESSGVFASTHQGGKVSLWCRSGPERMCIQLTLSNGAKVTAKSNRGVGFVCQTGLFYIGAAQKVGDGAGRRRLRA